MAKVTLNKFGNSIESAEITNGSITNDDINASAAITESKLALNHATHDNSNDHAQNTDSGTTSVDFAINSADASNTAHLSADTLNTLKVIDKTKTQYIDIAVKRIICKQVAPTAPLSVDTNTTLVPNLNADKLDGADLETTWTDSDVKICSSKAMKAKVDAMIGTKTQILSDFWCDCIDLGIKRLSASSTKYIMAIGSLEPKFDVTKDIKIKFEWMWYATESTDRTMKFSCGYAGIGEQYNSTNLQNSQDIVFAAGTGDYTQQKLCYTIPADTLTIGDVITLRLDRNNVAGVDLTGIKFFLEQ